MPIENNRGGANAPKVDIWRDSMVEQVSEYMDLIKDMDTKMAIGADTVLAETFEEIQDNSTDAVMGMLDVYSRSDTSGRSAIAEVFYALTGITFDCFLMQASNECRQTLCLVEDESIDEMMAHTAEVVGDSELGEELGVSNEER